MAWYHFQRATKLPTPGAMEYGLVTEWLATQPYIGPAIGFATQMRNFAPQNAQASGQVAMTGVGGLVQGQISLQPLSDPYAPADNGGSAYNWSDV